MTPDYLSFPNHQALSSQLSFRVSFSIPFVPDGPHDASSPEAMFPEFISTDHTSLKICGVTTRRDANQLADLGVSALGLNFWPSSKRYCSPEQASLIASHIAGHIIRVGVFVNNSRPLALDLVDECVIDVVQLHGDETQEDIDFFLERDIPVIRALPADQLPDHHLPTRDFALLVDTPAGSDYGGTGKTFDWSLAKDFARNHPQVPLILAGGLNPENAAQALKALEPSRPVALDIASGAEISPGIKDFDKVKSLLATLAS
jgi:phosphoribosylanthranilate isomerase